MIRILIVSVLLLAFSTSRVPPQQLSGGAAGPSAPLVIGETFTLASSVLREERRINVYAPAGYAESPELRLPVLYMPDGGIKEDFLHVAGLVQVLVGNGTMRPFLLVGIENTERRRDLTGPTDNAEDRKVAPRVGGSAAFRSFVRDELMPEVKTRYRTTAEAAIVGESFAGLFVVETFLLEPGLFDTYIAFDPSLWWNDARLVKEAAPSLRQTAQAGKTLFIASGADAGLGKAIDALVTAMGKTGARVQHERMPGETHATIYHPAALLAFRALFKPTGGK